MGRSVFLHAPEIAQPGCTRKEAAADGTVRSLSGTDRAFVEVGPHRAFTLRYVSIFQRHAHETCGFPLFSNCCTISIHLWAEHARHSDKPRCQTPCAGDFVEEVAQYTLGNTYAGMGSIGSCGAMIRSDHVHNFHALRQMTVSFTRGSIAEGRTRECLFFKCADTGAPLRDVRAVCPCFCCDSAVGALECDSGGRDTSLPTQSVLLSLTVSCAHVSMCAVSKTMAVWSHLPSIDVRLTRSVISSF